MKILKPTVAGSLESNDALITINPVDKDEIKIIVESIVEKQYRDKIYAAVAEILKDFNITSGVHVRVQDRGALDCTLKARVEAAILRGKGE